MERICKSTCVLNQQFSTGNVQYDPKMERERGGVRETRQREVRILKRKWVFNRHLNPSLFWTTDVSRLSPLLLYKLHTLFLPIWDFPMGNSDPFPRHYFGKLTCFFLKISASSRPDLQSHWNHFLAVC